MNCMKKKSLASKSLAAKVFRRSLQAVIGFHLLTQVNYCIRGTSQSKERDEFEREFGFAVQGFRGDVEENKEKLSEIADAVQKEKIEKPFDLTAIRISSKHYVGKSIFGQLEHLAIKGGEAYSGINYPLIGRIYINSDSVHSSTVHHEIKHAKTDSLLLNRPEFKQRWVALAVDDDGNDLYTGYVNWVLSKARFVGKWVTRKEVKDYEKAGFITSYAALGFYEDVAETCEEAESRNSFSIDKLIKLLYMEKNEKIIAKINLAQEYDLIPAEFSDYILLQKSFQEKEESKEALGALLAESGIFLAEHPASVYEITLRKKRGRMLEKEERYVDAIAEYKLGLLTEYKYHDDYPDLLSDISDCYRKMNKTENSGLYSKAKERYELGWKANDIHIAVHGVNDFLRENGEEL